MRFFEQKNTMLIWENPRWAVIYGTPIWVITDPIHVVEPTISILRDPRKQLHSRHLEITHTTAPWFYNALFIWNRPYKR